MKNKTLFKGIAFIILVLFHLTSCNDEESPESIYQNLFIKSWKLTGINYTDPPSYLVYDSMRCINDVPYGFAKGEKYELTANSSQPDSFTDYHENREYWTFHKNDSLIITRDGHETGSCFCENNKVRCYTTEGFPILQFKASWIIENNYLLISNNGEVYSYEINTINSNKLILTTEDEELIFSTQE